MTLDGGVIFTVPGKPQGKARARTVCDPRTGRVHSYTPEKTAAYEALIRQYYKINRGIHFGGAVMLRVEIAAIYEIPKSYSKKKVEEIRRDDKRPTVKPDCDNIIKAVLDALNGVAYDDDAQVVAVSCSKRYAAEGEDAHITVRIEKI